MSKMKFKRGEAERIGLDLMSVVQLPGQKFSYAVMKNLKQMEAILRDNNKFRQSLPVPKFEEYEKKRIDVCLEFATKDEAGNPVIENKSYIIDNREEFDKQIALLGVEYKETIDAMADRDVKFNEYLQEEVEIEIHTVNEPDVSQYINGEQRMKIEFMLTDTAPTGLKLHKA